MQIERTCVTATCMSYAHTFNAPPPHPQTRPHVYNLEHLVARQLLGLK